MTGLLLALTLLAGSARAQDAARDAAKDVESVTVNGTRDRQVIDTFVKNLAAPAHLSGKITRWEDGVCPITVGLRSEATRFVSDRLKAVAKEVGAPVGRPGCTPNIEIVFTTDPQGLMNTVRKERPQLLGFAYTTHQMDELAKVTRPIQAWYTTQTRDLHGHPTIDLAHHSGPGIEISCPPMICYYPDANAVAVTGEKLGDGTRSDFYHVIVAADPTKLVDYSIGSIADAVVLLALSHVAAPDACQPLASIINLTVPGCSQVADELSANDLAFLRGLYSRMRPARAPSFQRDQIASQIQIDTAGR
ncbi:MAG: hypothetical protein H6924_06950 [Alphaproteobacteria bacterium]|nr:hypothetical protein [Alphaproteobacteria bacterium]